MEPPRLPAAHPDTFGMCKYSSMTFPYLCSEFLGERRVTGVPQ